MAPDPRLSDKELAKINAAAVTQEYHVQPHLGGLAADFLTYPIKYILFVRLPHSSSHQWVI